MRVLSPGCGRPCSLCPCAGERKLGQPAARWATTRRKAPVVPRTPAEAPDNPCLAQKDPPRSPTQIPDPQKLGLNEMVVILSH